MHCTESRLLACKSNSRRRSSKVPFLTRGSLEVQRATPQGFATSFDAAAGDRLHADARVHARNTAQILNKPAVSHSGAGEYNRGVYRQAARRVNKWSVLVRRYK